MKTRAGETNTPKNKGRRIDHAIKRFTRMLLEEAHDVSGLPYSKLADELNISEELIRRYKCLPGKGKTRAPLPSAIQRFENRVAKFLGRPAHTVVIVNNKKATPYNLHLQDFRVEDKPSAGLNLRNFEATDFSLEYEGEWPTYRRLKAYGGNVQICDLVNRGAHSEWPPILRFYSWQWGILWNKNLPWLLRQGFGVPPNTPVALFLPEVMAKQKKERMLYPYVNLTPLGRDLLRIREFAFNLENIDLVDRIGAHIIEVGEWTKQIVEMYGDESFSRLEGVDGLFSPPEPEVVPPDVDEGPHEPYFS